MKRPGGTFGIPFALAASSLIALIVGLLGEGAVDVVAWSGLALPLVAILRALQVARRADR